MQYMYQSSQTPHHLVLLLGPLHNPEWEYSLVLPTSVPHKAQRGWSLVLEDADSILGQSLCIIGRAKEN